MASLISNSYVLVTGGSGGIGAALCRRLPSIGCLPVVAYDGNEASANADMRHPFADLASLMKKGKA